jgi:peptidyl-prolyl cis-trans isomerase D
MLERLRSGVRSWVAQALLALLVVSFAIWGMGDVTRGFSTKVATVGDQAVEADLFATVLRNESQRYGIDPAQIRASGLDRFVLGRLTREAAFDEATARLGISAPDAAVAAEVRAQPAFQVGGAFDAQAYAAAVRRAFPSVAAYEESVRRSLAADALTRAATDGATAPAGVARLVALHRLEARRFEAITLDAPTHGDAPRPPTDADLQALLDAEPAAFAEPERRDATLLVLDAATLAEAAGVDDAAVRALYDERRAAYTLPERRAIDQIVFPAAAEAADARARLDAGTLDFDGLLAERGLSRADAALGAVSAAEIGEARAAAAFALAAPGVAGPVEMPTGHALLEVRAIEPAVVTPFEDVREELLRELAAERVGPEIDDRAERVADARAAGATLEEAAAEAGAAILAVAGVAADGALADGTPAPVLAARPEVVAEIFAAAAAEEEREPLRLDDDSVVIVRVDAVAPAPAPSLDAARPALAAAWETAERRRSLAAKIETARAQVAGGAPLAEAAAALGVAVERIGPLRRDDPEPRLGAEARAALFAAEPGAAAVTLFGDLATLAVLSAVEPPADLDASVAAAERALAASVGADQLEYLGRALEIGYGAAINEQALDAAISRVGG